MTESRQYVRVLLYGCTHKPKFGAMGCPVKGDSIYCVPCGRGRTVTGIETGWAKATMRCRSCAWTFSNINARRRRGKREMFDLAHRHADTCGHRVVIEHDGFESVIRPVLGAQIPLIDDLLLPERVTKP